MRVDFKMAVLQSGRYQFEIAQAIGVSEGRLSRFIRGREQLNPDKERRLREVLQLPAVELCEVEEAHVG